MADEPSTTPDINAQPAAEAPAPETQPPAAPTVNEAPASPPLSEAPAPEPVQVLTPDRPWFWGTGRRKTAVARVRMRPGSGVFRIQKTCATSKAPNKAFKSIDEYFSEIRDREDVVAPLKETGTFGRVDVYVRVDGGGYMGQAGAIVLGVARALKKYDATLEGTLRDNGFLSRDPRKVERKKYGQRGARRRFQFSKR